MELEIRITHYRGGIFQVVAIRDISERRRRDLEFQENKKALRYAQQITRISHFSYFIEEDQWKSSQMLDQVFGIVSQNRGHIIVESEENKGSVFNIFLPEYQGLVTLGEASNELGILHSEDNGMLLIIEDDPIVLDVHLKMIKALGYQTLFAKSGLEAVEVYRHNQEKIGLVISDMVMKDRRGDWVYEQLRAINPGLPFLVVSGYPLDAEVFAMNTGNDISWLQKPVKLRDLAEAIQKKLKE